MSARSEYLERNFLPEAKILFKQPRTLRDAHELLRLTYLPKAYASAENELPITSIVSLAKKERPHVSHHLQELGAAPPHDTYDLRHIGHDGRVVDLKLKCLLVMGMCLKTLLQDKVNPDRVRPYLVVFAQTYMKHILPEVGADTYYFPAPPGQVRIPYPSELESGLRNRYNLDR